MKTSNKSILYFLLCFVVVYIALMWPWKNVRAGYRDALIHCVRLTYAVIPMKGEVKVLSYDQPGHKDTVVVRPDSLYIGVNTGEVGYLPTALLLSLIVATPVAWKRRLIGLLTGFALVNIFIQFRFVVLALHLNSLTIPGPDMVPMTDWERTINAGSRFLAVGPGLAYVVSVLIWVIALLRRDDLAAFFGDRSLDAPPADRKTD